MFALCLFVFVLSLLLYFSVRVCVFLKKHGQTVPAPVRKRRGYRYPPNDALYDALHEQALEDANNYD